MFSEELKLLFTNYSFLVFFALLVPVYFLVPKKWQWCVLLAASYLFYFFTSSALPVYMIATTLTVFFAAKKIDRIEQKMLAFVKENKSVLDRDERKKLKNKTKKEQRVYLLSTVIFNIGLLVFLKYINMFIGTANSIFSTDFTLLKIAVPLGISYYTLQSIGYLVDVYRGKYRCENNIAKFALFVSFFAQIVQGPFGRFDHLGKQLFEEHKFSFERLKSGLVLMLYGYFKKLVIADTLSLSLGGVYANCSEYNGIQLFAAALLYSVQIYADFSGYMDIATGVCEILGIELAKNFDRPYFSKSVQEFWRRWHITLGAWFKDYVFFPLSVSKVAVNLSKKCRKKGWLNLAKLLPSYIALLFVWSLTGLWHGAEWKYVLWGAGNCLFILINMQFEPLFEKLKSKLKIKNENLIWRCFQIVRTFITISLLRLLSITPSYVEAGIAYKKIFTLADVNSFGLSSILPNIEILDLLVVMIGCVVIYIISMLQFKYPKVREQLFTKNYFVQSAVIMVLIFSIIIFGTYGSGVDIGGFIYAQF